MNKRRCIVIGGGAAGFFGAIICAQASSKWQVTLIEKTNQLLSKVKISGGGRCNVTHACFDPARLSNFYPRGGAALRGPFTRFQPRDTIAWFEERGVQLKVEEDGRMFPISDSSQTIIDCLVREANRANVEIRLRSGVERVQREDQQFKVTLSSGEELLCEALLVATGSAKNAEGWLTAFGHTLVPPVPSLFTFEIPSSPLLDLAGISVDPAKIAIPGTEWEQTGPLLLTHWGFSGPAALKLSAWAARDLHARQYRTDLKVSWLPNYKSEQLRQELIQRRSKLAKRLIDLDPIAPIPKQLWKRLIQLEQLNQAHWAELSNQAVESLVQRLLSDRFQMEGKATYKQEFVTCGGINLKEVDFKRMESRLQPGLFFAGEVLDIDGVTGGFNFQSAWTTSWIAGKTIAGSSEETL